MVYYQRYYKKINNDVNGNNDRPMETLNNVEINMMISAKQNHMFLIASFCLVTSNHAPMNTIAPKLKAVPRPAEPQISSGTIMSLTGKKYIDKTDATIQPTIADVVVTSEQL